MPPFRGLFLQNYVQSWYLFPCYLKKCSLRISSFMYFAYHCVHIGISSLVCRNLNVFVQRDYKIVKSQLRFSQGQFYDHKGFSQAQVGTFLAAPSPSCSNPIAPPWGLFHREIAVFFYLDESKFCTNEFFNIKGMLKIYRNLYWDVDWVVDGVGSTFLGE